MEIKIKRLLYLRKQLDGILDNAITDYVLKDKEVSANQLNLNLMYQIEDNLDLYEKGR